MDYNQFLSLKPGETVYYVGGWETLHLKVIPRSWVSVLLLFVTAGLYGFRYTKLRRFEIVEVMHSADNGDVMGRKALVGDIFTHTKFNCNQYHFSRPQVMGQE